MKKALRKTALMMMLSQMMGGDSIFDTGLHRDPHEGETDEQRKQRLHKMYGDNSQEHEFVIKGEHIMARDKKTALKIYGNRHPEKKKTKK